MKPLLEVADAVTVVAPSSAFCEAVALAFAPHQKQLITRCRRPYLPAPTTSDGLFDQMLAALAPKLTGAPPRPGDFAAYAGRSASGSFRNRWLTSAIFPAQPLPRRPCGWQSDVGSAGFSASSQSRSAGLFPPAFRERGRRWILGRCAPAPLRLVNQEHSMTRRRYKILILHANDDLPRVRRTSFNHAFCLLKYAPWNTYELHSFGQPVTRRLRRERFDAILLDTTFLCWRWAVPREQYLGRILRGTMHSLRIATPLR